MATIKNVTMRYKNSTNTNTWTQKMYPDELTELQNQLALGAYSFEIVSIDADTDEDDTPPSSPINWGYDAGGGGGFDPVSEFAFQSGLGFGIGYSLDNSRTWNQLKSDYTHIGFRFNVRVTGVTEDVLRVFYVHVDDIVDVSRWRFEYGTAIIDIQPGPLTAGDFTMSGGVVDSIGLEIFGIGATSVEGNTAVALKQARFTLSADAAGIVCPFDEGQGDTDVIVNAAGTITLPAGKYRIQTSCTRQAAVLDYELYNLTNAQVLERFSISGLSDVGSGNTAPYYLEVATPIQIQIREGDGLTSVIWNGREAGLDAGFNNVLHTYACYIDIQQVATLSVIEPDTVTASDQSASNYFDIGNMRLQWGTFATSNSDNDETVTLPAPFGNTAYSVVLQPTSTPGDADVGVPWAANSRALSSFTVNRDDNIDSFTTNLLWFAIGLKP